MNIDFKKHINAMKEVSPRPHKCTKRNCDYSFYIKCTCGAEASVESWYWNTFKYCPGCGTTCEEVK